MHQNTKSKESDGTKVANKDDAFEHLYEEL